MKFIFRCKLRFWKRLISECKNLRHETQKLAKIWIIDKRCPWILIFPPQISSVKCSHLQCWTIFLHYQKMLPILQFSIRISILSFFLLQKCQNQSIVPSNTWMNEQRTRGTMGCLLLIFITFLTLRPSKVKFHSGLVLP